MWFKFSQFILRYRIAIISIIALLTAMFGYYAFTSLEMDNQFGNTLPKNSPAQDEYLKFKEMFGENKGVLVIAIQTDSLYTEENFLKWKDLGDSIAGLNGIRSVFSEADLFTINNNTKKRKFEVEPIFKDTTFQRKSINKIREQIRQVPLYDGLLYNDSTNVSLMMVSIEEAYLADQNRSHVVLDAEAIALGYQSTFGKIHFAGLPHIRIVLAKRVVNEMYIFIGLTIFVTSLLLYIFFRSLRVVLFCNIVVFTAVIWSLGSIAMMGFKISILMAMIPPLMIVIGIPDCIYLLMKFHQEFKGHGNKMKALSRVIQRVGNATFLTNLTTALGFCTFIFVNSVKLAEFGIASSLNIIGVFILSITIIPILFSFSKRPKKRHLRHLDKRFARTISSKLAYITTTHRKRIYMISAGVIVIALIGSSQMETTGNLTSDLPEGDPILKDIHFIQDNFKGAIPFEILINYKNDARKFDPGLLKKIETVQENLKKDSTLSKSLSIVNFMKLINMAYYGNNPQMFKLIKRKDMLNLKDYVDAFQKDLAQKKIIFAYQDSIREGNLSYDDSLLLISPKIAKEVLNYEPIDTIDSLDVSPYPSHEEVASYLSKHESSKAALNASEKLFPSAAVGLSLKELIDTANTTLRIRMQIFDLGSYEMSHKIDQVSAMLDTVLNPNYEHAMTFYQNVKKGDVSYVDSIFNLSNAYRNNVTAALAEGNDSLQFQFDLHPELLATYYKKDNFNSLLKEAVEKEKLDYYITGVSVVVAEGTQYLISNLLTSIIFAVITIALLMALLFGSWRMVLISMIPNIIPLVVTAGLMGFMGIPLKPSTLLVFSIAFGISVDNTIQFLSRYRHQMKHRSYDKKGCIIYALSETGATMYYTAIVLICGFSLFVFSQFGGTKALGLLISLTLLIALFTNSMLVPALLFSLEKNFEKKAFKEPLIKIYDEEVDINLSELKVGHRIRKSPEKDESPDKKEEEE